MEYTYQGDRIARHMQSPYVGKACKAIRQDGKCIRGRNANMLVEFEDGSKQVIPARMLRKIK
ncbi:hypothetical protein [uncultured Pontibacter sp.]|uniref:hypothetical protein n=1 Tax=uncultured Pontibacter sp. TaxID=453356 RepID=UPI0026334A45|nr:hypothetical protein [uncultured Pontibacter sp.]